MTKLIKQQGVIKRISNFLSYLKHKGNFFLLISVRVDNLTNNIFLPTVAIQMLQHLAKITPDHSIVLSDFDSFLMPSNSIPGINAPLVTHKLKDPTQWKTYETYLIDRGAADICFPVDFNYLEHAYESITG